MLLLLLLLPVRRLTAVMMAGSIRIQRKPAAPQVLGLLYANASACLPPAQPPVPPRPLTLPRTGTPAQLFLRFVSDACARHPCAALVEHVLSHAPAGATMPSASAISGWMLPLARPSRPVQVLLGSTLAAPLLACPCSLCACADGARCSRAWGGACQCTSSRPSICGLSPAVP